MEVQTLHSWELTPKEAVSLQRELQKEVVLTDGFSEIRYVAGVDVGFLKSEKRGRAAVVILRLSDLEVVDSAVAEAELRFPYVPGLLSFREIPLIVEALAKIRMVPDLVLCDGQGIAHPRRFGIACHLGLMTGIPTVGVAKTKLCGSFDDPPTAKGEWTPLMDHEQLVGAVLRTRQKVKPVFVSPGHNISLPSAIDLVMRCVTKYRLPETTRQAHALSQFSSGTHGK